jgi:formiminotetrahydrofolate cyclodeaminase
MSSLFSFITGGSPTGIVAVAAASASLAVRVLRGVLEISARKHNAEALTELIHSAEREAGNLARLAEEDGEVYAAYMQARRERSANVQAALQRAIESPLSAARSASAGIDLCRKALPFFKGAIAADVSGAAVLLAGSVRALLGCVEANLVAVEDPHLSRAVKAESQSLADRAIIKEDLSRAPRGELPSGA